MLPNLTMSSKSKSKRSALITLVLLLLIKREVKHPVLSFREVGDISVKMNLPVLPSFFLLLLPSPHLVAGHPARTLVQQVSNTLGTALKCVYNFQEPWFHQLFVLLSNEVRKERYIPTRRGHLARFTVRMIMALGK